MEDCFPRGDQLRHGISFEVMPELRDRKLHARVELPERRVLRARAQGRILDAGCAGAEHMSFFKKYFTRGNMVGFITPVMLRRVEVLPTPLRPMRQKHWWSGTSNCTPLRMRLPPMESSRDWTESMAVKI